MTDQFDKTDIIMTTVLCLKCEYRFQANTDIILERNFRCPSCGKRQFSFPDEPEYTLRDSKGNIIKGKLIHKKKSGLIIKFPDNTLNLPSEDDKDE